MLLAIFCVILQLHHNQTIEDKLTTLVREIREGKTVLRRSLGTGTIQLKDGFQLHTDVLKNAIPLSDLGAVRVCHDDDDEDDDASLLILLYMR